MFYDIDTNTNSSSKELKSHMEDIVWIIIMLQQSDKGFDSGKKPVLEICTKSLQMDLVQYKVLNMTF